MLRLHFGRKSLFATALVTVTAAAGLLYAGMRIGADLMMQQVYANADGSRPFWEREVLSQRQLIADLQKNTGMHLNALALKLGEMQAHVTRLDALGERLVGMAKLRRGEFDFSAAPPVGGPARAPQAPSGLQDIVAAYDKLSADIEDRSEKLAALESLLMNRKLQDEIFPTGLPLKEGWMSSGFGLRTDPVTGRKEFHRGIDYTGPYGSEVLAMAAGVVSWSGWRNEFGNVVEITHGNGYITRYSHNKKNLVQIGEKVGKGQPIAVMGATGRTTGAHVHFEVLQDGNIVNPVKYLQSAEDAPKNG